MIGALWNGVSGLNSHDKGITVQSNNIANANTIAFKQDEIAFEDLLYQNRIGKGSKVQTVNKDFSQGNLKPTNSSIDVAIDGSGFFVVQDGSGQKFYTRAGNFTQAEDGYLRTQTGLIVMGISPNISEPISTAEPKESIFTDKYSKNITSITINAGDIAYNINARATNYINSAISDSIEKSGNNYKTSGSKISDVEAALTDYNQKLKLFQSDPQGEEESKTQKTEVNYSKVLNELKNENNFISVSVDNHVLRQQFDTNIETTLKKLSDQISNLKGFTSTVDTETGIFTIENIIPGKEFRVYDTIVNDNISLQQVGNQNTQIAILGSGLGMVESSRDALQYSLKRANADFLEITNKLDFTEDKTFDGSMINTNLDTLNLIKDAKGEVTIEDDGFVFVNLEGNKFLVGKLGTANFRSETNLNAVGSNLYSFTTSLDKDDPEYPKLITNADKTNKIVSNFLENSNVSMASTLTMLMVYQRGFEANSKSITTSDEMLQKAMDMKR